MEQLLPREIWLTAQWVGVENATKLIKDGQKIRPYMETEGYIE